MNIQKNESKTISFLYATNAWLNRNIILFFCIIAIFFVLFVPREQHRQVIANDAVVESIYQCLECVK